MKKGKVFYRERVAGIIEQTDGVYRFTYSEDYLKLKNAKPVSLLFPLRGEPFEEKRLN